MRALVAAYHTMGCLGLKALLRHGFDVRAVLTHPANPGETIWWRSVEREAGDAGIPVHRFEDLSDAAIRDRLARYEPDFLFSFYYRHLIPTSILRLARRGAFNLHGSLLPKYRGRAPVNWVLVHGETETGVTLHHMVDRPDAGDLVDQERVTIDVHDTAFTLYAKLHHAAVRLLDRALPGLKAGIDRRTPPDLKAGSCFGARRPEDGRMDWAEPAVTLYNLVRAVTHPYPGAFTWFRGRKLYVWWALPREGASDAPPGAVLGHGPEGILVSTGAGSLRLVTVQVEGEPELPACAFCEAAGGPRVGERLGPDGGRP